MSDEKDNKTSSEDQEFVINSMILDLRDHVLIVEQSKDSTEIHGALKQLEEGLMSLKNQVGDTASLDLQFGEDIKELELELSRGKEKLASLQAKSQHEQGASGSENIEVEIQSLLNEGKGIVEITDPVNFNSAANEWNKRYSEFDAKYEQELGAIINSDDAKSPIRDSVMELDEMHDIVREKQVKQQKQSGHSVGASEKITEVGKASEASPLDAETQINLYIADLKYPLIMDIYQSDDPDQLSANLKQLEEGYLELQNKIIAANFGSEFNNDILEIKEAIDQGKQKLEQLGIDRALAFSPEDQEFLDTISAQKGTSDAEKPPVPEVPAAPVVPAAARPAPPPRPAKPVELSPQIIAAKAAKRMSDLIDASGPGNSEIQREIQGLLDAGNINELCKLLGDINHELSKSQPQQNISFLTTLNTKDPQAMPKIFDQVKSALNSEKTKDNTEALQRMRFEVLTAMMKYVLGNPQLDQKNRDLMIGAVYVNGSNEDRKILNATGISPPGAQTLNAMAEMLGVEVPSTLASALTAAGGLFSAVAEAAGLSAGQTVTINEHERVTALADINSEFHIMPSMDDVSMQLMDFSFLHYINAENIMPSLKEFEKRSEGSEALLEHFEALKNLDERSHEDLVTIAVSLEFVSDFIFHIRNILDKYGDDLSSSQKMRVYRELQLKSDALMQAQEKLVEAMIYRVGLLEPGVLENLSGGDYDKKYLCEYSVKTDEKIEKGVKSLLKKASEGNAVAREMLSKFKHIYGSDLIKYLVYVGKYGDPEKSKDFYRKLPDVIEADHEKVGIWLGKKLSEGGLKMQEDGFHAMTQFMINNKKLFQNGEGVFQPLVITQTEFLDLYRLMNPKISMIDPVRDAAGKKFFENRDEFRQFCSVTEKFNGLQVGSQGVIGWDFEKFVKKCQSKEEFWVCAEFVAKCKTTDEFLELVNKYTALNQRGKGLYAMCASKFEGVSDVSKLLGHIQGLQEDERNMYFMVKILEKFQQSISYEEFIAIADSLEKGNAPLFFGICLREARSVESYNNKIQEVDALVGDSPALKALGRISDVKVLSSRLGLSGKDLISVLEEIKETLGDDGVQLIDKLFNQLVEKKLIHPDNNKDAQSVVNAAFLAIAMVKNAMDVVEALPDYQQNRGEVVKRCFDRLSDSIKKLSDQFPGARAVVSELLQEFCVNVDRESIVKKINDPERDQQHAEVVGLFVSVIGKLGSLEKGHQKVIDEAFLFTKEFPQKDEEHEAALALVMSHYRDVVLLSPDDANAFQNANELEEKLLTRPAPDIPEKLKKELSDKVCVELLDRKKQAGLKLPRSKMMEVAIDLARQYRNAKEGKSEIIAQVKQFKAELDLIEKFLDKEKNPKQSAELEKVKAGINRIINQHNNKAYTLPKKILRIFKRPSEDVQQRHVVRDGLLNRFKRKRGSADESDRKAAQDEEVSREAGRPTKKARGDEKYPQTMGRLSPRGSGKKIDGGETPAQGGPGSPAKK